MKCTTPHHWMLCQEPSPMSKCVVSSQLEIYGSWKTHQVWRRFADVFGDKVVFITHAGTAGIKKKMDLLQMVIPKWYFHWAYVVLQCLYSYDLIMAYVIIQALLRFNLTVGSWMHVQFFDNRCHDPRNRDGYPVVRRVKREQWRERSWAWGVHIPQKSHR